jgi:hypothetical protein
MYFIILLILLIGLYFYSIENNKINFLEKKSVLTEDTDNFLKSLSVVDLFARKAKSLDTYLSKIKVIPFTDSEKERLIILSNQVDNLIIEKGILDPKLANIKWYFCKSTKSYENGLPHTRQWKDTTFIVLTEVSLKKDNSDLRKTLLHEKVHVYQKKFPEETEECISNLGFKKVGLRKGFHERLRANPDLNKFIYSKNGKLYYSLYKSNFPKGISDTYTTSEFEDPKEKIAYELEELI